MFQDRRDAGIRLAELLKSYAHDKPVVLALPRGGVPVAAEVARALGAPLDVVIVRKIGVPGQPELAMGALADADRPVTIRNDDVIGMAGVSRAAFNKVRDVELAEARRRRELYIGKRPRPALKSRTVIVIDDGIATGASMRAALKAIRTARPSRIVLAVPVAARSTLESLRRDADDVVCVDEHEDLGAIGLHYNDFEQVGDEEVIAALRTIGTAGP